MISDKLTGSYAWGLKTGGSLNKIAEINLVIQVMLRKMKRKIRSSVVPVDFDVKEIALPDSKLVSQTLEFINDVHRESLKNHCLRAFVLGDIFGKNEHLKYDRELYALSALLHDIGLENDYCCLHKDIDCFAIEGAYEAGKFLEQFQLTKEKVNIVKDSIALHLNIKIPELFTEAYLLNKASATDVVGLYRNQISDKTAQDIMKRYPRHNFNEEIHQLLKAQCRMRPKSRISFLYSNGFGGMLKENRFDRNLH